MDPNVKEWVKSNSFVVEKKEKFTIYEPKTEVKHEDKHNKVCVMTIGPKNDREVKTVLLVGETGSGKTAFLNSFLNMVFGVNFNDEVRLKLKNQVEEPSHIVFMIYHQNGMPYPYNYMVIDSYGLGDDSDDSEKGLRLYLSKNDFVKHLNCIGLVWKASNRRLDEQNREILSKMKKFLAYDLKSIRDILLTFSPHEDYSAVVAIETFGIEYEKVFHFENAPLFEWPAQKQRQEMVSLMWEYMVKSHQKFFQELNERQPEDLKTTSELYVAQADLDTIEKSLNDLEKKSTHSSKNFESLKAKLLALETDESRVDWDKLKELDESREEIDLHVGKHCHYCNTCCKACVQICSERHDVNIDMPSTPAKSSSDLRITKSTNLPYPVNYLLVPIFFILPLIVFIISTFRERRSSGPSYAQPEPILPCKICGHFDFDHETRQKIMAKDATYEQKMEFMQKRKCQEMAGQKAALRAEIDSLGKKLEEIQSQMEEGRRELEKRQRKVEELQTGENGALTFEN